MRHPVISRSNLKAIADKRVEGLEVEVDPFVEWVGSGEEVDLRPIAALSEAIIQGLENQSDRDLDIVEGLNSQALYEALAQVPTHVLDDRGFWRYLSAKYFWDFIAWRQPKSFKPDGKYLKYVDGAKNTETVLVRMYLRAAALGGRDKDADVLGGIRKAGDFWRSHVVRVQTGSAVNIASALARKQLEERQTTDPLRAKAKRLNRTWTNVILHMYDEDEARDIVQEIWNIG